MNNTNTTAILTGATGFLGKVIFGVIKDKYDVITIGRQGCDFNFDISSKFTLDLIKNPSLVVHCAGLAHKKFSDEEFYSVNYDGTKNLLDSLDNANCTPQRAVFISTVAVYGRTEGVDILEIDNTKPENAYGASKLKAEQFFSTWAITNDIDYLILRLPLVIGSNPKGNLKKMISAINNKFYIRVKNKPTFKSVVLASDVAMLIRDWNGTSGVYNLSNLKPISISQIETALMKRLKTKFLLSIKYDHLSFILSIVDGLIKPFSAFRLMPYGEKLTKSLTFSSNKASKELGWKCSDILSFIENEIEP